MVSPKLIIDGDMLSFRASSVCEKRFIRVTHLKSGDVKEFKNRDEFHGRNKLGGWLAGVNEGRTKQLTLDDFSIEDIQEAEPVKNVHQVLNSMIRKMCTEQFTDEYHIVVGRGECHRHKIILPEGQKYKESRDDLTKPIHAEAAKDYLINKKGAELYKGETDDRLAMYAHEGHQYVIKSGNEIDNPYTICAIDKDQFAISGRYWNPFNNSEPFYVDGLGELTIDTSGKNDKIRGTGRMFTYFQMLTSDSVDNVWPKRIPGKKIRCGEKEVYENLILCNTDSQALQYVSGKYREWFAPEGEITYKAWNGKMETDNWISWFDKHFTLYHMMRWEGDFINTKELLKTMGCLRRGE